MVHRKLHNFLDLGTGRAKAEGGEQSVARFVSPLGRHFDGAVGAVADPPCQLQPVRGIAHEPPESYPVYKPDEADVKQWHAAKATARALATERICGRTLADGRSSVAALRPRLPLSGFYSLLATRYPLARAARAYSTPSSAASAAARPAASEVGSSPWGTAPTITRCPSRICEATDSNACTTARAPSKSGSAGTEAGVGDMPPGPR
jgi:hypothetical protein